MPNKRLPVYKLVIDEDAEGMDFMGLVDYPAHGKNWIAFNQLPKRVEFKQHFNEEKRIVTGVAIATDLQIYRRDPNGFEYNIVFTKEDVLTMIKMLSKRNYFNNVNLMHDMSRKVKDTFLIELYFIKADKSNIPSEFAYQNIQPGSVVMSYWVEGKETWEFVKKNGAGFSIEGWFKEVEVKFHKQKNQMKKKSLLERLFPGRAPQKHVYDKAKKDKYKMAKTVDGVEVTWEGDLAAGTPLFVVPTDGTDPMLASAGEYAIDVDGVIMVCTVDEAGLITAVVEGEEMDDEELEAALAAIKKDYEKKLADQRIAMKKEFDAQVTEMATDIDELREIVETFAEGEIDPATGKKKKVINTQNPGWRKKKAKA